MVIEETRTEAVAAAVDGNPIEAGGIVIVIPTTKVEARSDAAEIPKMTSDTSQAVVTALIVVDPALVVRRIE